MGISESAIKENEQRFIELINSIDRPGMRKEELVARLQNSDFFTAPASTKYHAAYKGGLCQHSLNVYDNLCKLAEMKGLYGAENCIHEDSIKICGLLHDLAKISFYETCYQNKKFYSENGSKKDEGGRYDWVAVSSYKVIDQNERFLYGNHECTSEYLVRCFVPLSLDESVAFIHHHGSMSFDSAKDDIGAVFNRYPLACLLYMADMMGAYIDEHV